MVYAKSVLLLLVTKLLVVTAKDKIGTDCKKKKCDFGEPFEVSFKLDKDADSCCNERWIGIFDSKEKNPTHRNAQFKARACGIGQNPDDYCSNLKTGTAVFDNIDPPEGYHRSWPANPGKYIICHLNDDDELIQKCGKVEVVLSSKIKKDIKKRAFVEPTKEVYEYGEDVVADFDSVYAYPNTMIAISKKDSNYALYDIHTGCNNFWGDQRWSPQGFSHNCIKTQKSGQVMFTRVNTHRNEPMWPGEYEMRLLISYDRYKSNTDDFADVVSTFTVNPKPVSSKSPSSKSPSSKSPSITASADDD